MSKAHLPIVFLLCVACATIGITAAQQKAEKSNMELVGYSDLQDVAHTSRQSISKATGGLLISAIMAGRSRTP
jgi:hypothetical protein